MGWMSRANTAPPATASVPLRADWKRGHKYARPPANSSARAATSARPDFPMRGDSEAPIPLHPFLLLLTVRTGALGCGPAKLLRKDALDQALHVFALVRPERFDGLAQGGGLWPEVVDQVEGLDLRPLVVPLQDPPQGGERGVELPQARERLRRRHLHAREGIRQRLHETVLRGRGLFAQHRAADGAPIPHGAVAVAEQLDAARIAARREIRRVEDPLQRITLRILAHGLVRSRRPEPRAQLGLRKEADVADLQNPAAQLGAETIERFALAGVARKIVDLPGVRVGVVKLLGGFRV